MSNYTAALFYRRPGLPAVARIATVSSVEDGRRWLLAQLIEAGGRSEPATVQGSAEIIDTVDDRTVSRYQGSPAAVCAELAASFAGCEPAVRGVRH